MLATEMDDDELVMLVKVADGATKVVVVPILELVLEELELVMLVLVLDTVF